MRLNRQDVTRRSFWIWSVLITLLMGLFWFPNIGQAQEPTITISDFSGQVTVSIRGQAPAAAKVGDVLRAGDTITTQVGAEVALTLSEGSELHLGENTKIDVATLVQRTSGAHQSRVKLLNGRVRAFLSPGHQKKGSSFTVETPNATAGVKFSQPHIEVLYDSETRTTIILGYTVPVVVRNLISKEFKTMAKEHQAIVQDEFLWISPIESGVMEIPRKERAKQSQAGLLLQTRQCMGGIASPAPVSSGARNETSLPLRPGRVPGLSRPYRVTIISPEE